MVNNTLTYRVDQLEKKYESLDGKIDSLLTNHIPHLQLDVVSMKTRINVLTAVNIGAIIIAIVVARILQ